MNIKFNTLPEERQRFVDDAFVGAIIGISEKRAPFWVGWLISLDSEPMVLRSDKASTSAFVSTWLVDSAIAVLHLESSEASS